MQKIDNFDGQFAFLSNFFACDVEYEGLIYPSSEHAYQAAKTLDVKARKVFTLPSMTAGMSKHLGKVIRIRPDWDVTRLQIMDDILVSKFANPQLRQRLLDTGDATLIEGNTWGDTFWGVCDGKGNNFLGKTLMNLRKKLATSAA